MATAKKADHAPSPTDVTTWAVTRAVIGRSRIAGGGNAVVEPVNQILQDTVDHHDEIAHAIIFHIARDATTIAALLACLRGADGVTTDIGECKPGHVPRCEPQLEIQLFGPGGHEGEDRVSLVTVANDALLVGVDARADNTLESYACFHLPDASRDALRLALEQHVVFA